MSRAESSLNGTQVNRRHRIQKKKKIDLLLIAAKQSNDSIIINYNGQFFFF